jgi:hypothetical protein
VVGFNILSLYPSPSIASVVAMRFFFFFFLNCWLLFETQMKTSIFLIALAGILDFVVGQCTGGAGAAGTLVPTSVSCAAAKGPALGL